MRYPRRLKSFPYATVQKRKTQPWTSLLTFSVEKKRLWKNQTRLFSMEYGRALSKRLFWQMALRKHFETSKNPLNSKKLLNQQWIPLQHPWGLFRSIFFAKMWLLNNPSLVPGVVWPVKSKKIHLAKMRAFQALSHLTGKNSRDFVLRILQKFWNLSKQTTPSLWSVAQGLESLKTHYLMKSGLVRSIPVASHWIQQGKIIVNGLLTSQTRSFQYPGDLMVVQSLDKFNNYCFFETLLAYGILKPGRHSQAKDTNLNGSISVYTVQPFLWLHGFFSQQCRHHTKVRRQKKHLTFQPKLKKNKTYSKLLIYYFIDSILNFMETVLNFIEENILKTEAPSLAKMSPR